MKTIWNFILNLLGIIGLVRKQVHAADEASAPESNWNPFIAAAVERERKHMIEKRLRDFFKRKPRPWISPNARARKLKEQRENARIEMEKRLRDGRGLQ